MSESGAVIWAPRLHIYCLLEACEHLKLSNVEVDNADSNRVVLLEIFATAFGAF